MWYKALQNLILIYPVYTLLFVEAGLDLTHISYLLAIWSIPVVLFEVPSGVLSDRWSRRGMLLLAALLKAACFTFWLIDFSFVFFALGFVCWGISEAFASGSEEALLFDSLKSQGLEHQFERWYGKAMAFSGVAVAISCITGGFAVQVFGFKVVLLFSLASCLGAFLLALSFKEVNLYRIREKGVLRTNLHVAREAFRHLVSTHSLRYMAALLIIPLSMAGLLDEYDPLIASSYGFAIAYVGYWVGLRYLLEAFGSFFAHRFSVISKHVGVVLSLVAGVFLLVSGFLPQYLAIPFYFLFYLLIASAQVIQENLVQASIEEHGRATVHSIISLATNFHAILIFFLLGLALGSFSLRVLILMISLYIIASSLLIWLSGSRNRISD